MELGHTTGYGTGLKRPSHLFCSISISASHLYEANFYTGEARQHRTKRPTVNLLKLGILCLCDLLEDLVSVLGEKATRPN